MNQQNSASNTSSNSASQSEQKKFFDLHTRGIGYLNRTRVVNTKGKGGRRGETFLACTINAIHGNAEDPNTSVFDCRVSGSDAQDIIQALMPDVEAKRKVIVAFCIGDIYAHVYERKVKVRNGDNQWQETGAMETAALIKGRLLQITHVKVDGEVAYRVDEDGLVHTSLKLPQHDPAEDSETQGSTRTGTDG